MKPDPYRNAREHQALIRANIAAAIQRGDLQRANTLRHAYADLLRIQLPPMEIERIEPSPINRIELP